MIPKNQRDNYERTDEQLSELRALLVAVDNLNDLDAKHPDRIWTIALTRLALAKLDTIDHHHSMEWVGIGGASDTLTEAELIEAREGAR
ncbi:MAG: hypothetical protein IE938_20655 [Pseudomonas balearica]|nr:hypothetical protein [Stutzerimonas balearica]